MEVDQAVSQSETFSDPAVDLPSLGLPLTEVEPQLLGPLSSADWLPPERRPAGIGPQANDTLALVLAAVAACVLDTAIAHHSGVTRASSRFSASLLQLLLTVPLLTIFLAPSRARCSLRSTLGYHLGSVASALGAGGLIAIAAWQLSAAVGLRWTPPPDAVLVLCGAALVTVTLGRWANHAPPRRQGRRGRRVLIVGTGLVADRLMRELAGAEDVEVIGCVDDHPLDPAACIGKLADVGRLCDRRNIDHIVVAFTKASSEEIIEALRPVHGRVPITVIPRLFDVVPSSAGVDYIGAGLAGISVGPATLGWAPRAMKRAMDVVGATLALVVLSPLMLLVALAVRLTSQGPALFRQERIRRGGSFHMLKFRSMYVSMPVHPAPADGEPVLGPFPKLKDDPRVTPVGRLIRRLSIDELPQLINVLKGEMSLVGPRPFVPDDAAWIAGWAQRRYLVRPGITGLWQVSGRNDLTFEEMCRLDTLYVGSWSIGLDLQILLRTLRAVLARSGAY